MIYIYIYIYTYIHIFIYTYISGYYPNGFVATHALGHMMYGCNRTLCAQVHELPQSHCAHNQEGTFFS